MKFKLSSAGWLIGLLLVSLSLAACGGSATPEAEVESAAPTEEATTTVAGAEEATSVETVTEATEEAVVQAPTAENLSDSSGPVTSQAACYPIDIPNNTLIAAVSDSDWSQGPADAPVTVIEYGDFQ